MKATDVKRIARFILIALIPVSPLSQPSNALANSGPPLKWSDYFCVGNEVCAVGDVNGDGRTDLIAFIKNTQGEPGRNDVYVALSTGSAFGPPQKWSNYFCVGNEVCAVGDVNGDGRTDLITFIKNAQGEPGRNDVFVGLSTGSAFGSPQKWSDYFCVGNEVCAVGDVNGDRKADLITFIKDTQGEPGRNDVFVGLSTGSAFGPPQKWSNYFCVGNEVCAVGDVNSDGRTDLITFIKNAQGEPGRNDVFVGLSTGSAFGSPQKWSDYFCVGNEVCAVGDVNGDRKADLITFIKDTQGEPGRNDVFVGLSTGSAFGSPQKWSDYFCVGNEVCAVGDVNGDRKADLITFIKDTQGEPGRNDVFVGLSD